MCVIRYCQHSEIMHVMMGRTHSTYTLDKKHERVYVVRKRIEDRPSEALSAVYNEPRRSRHVRQDVNGEKPHREMIQGSDKLRSLLIVVLRIPGPDNNDLN